MKMCQAFSAAEHQVALVTRDRRNEIEKHVADVFDFYGVTPTFSITKLPMLPIRGRNTLYSVMTQVKLLWIRPDMVYGRDLRGCMYSARKGISTVYESHAPVAGPGTQAERHFSRLIKLDSFKRLVVISEALRQIMIDRYPLLNNRLVVAHDGADPILEMSPKVQREPDQKLKIGYVGQLYPGRGMELIERIALDCDWAEFNIIGGMPDDIEYWKRRTGNISNVFFHGFLPHAEALVQASSYDMLLAPYQEKVSVYGGQGDTTGWMSPLKIFEYMATGKAIVCSDLPVLREVLEPGRTALFCQPGEHDQWITALDRLRTEPVFRRQLGESAKKEFLTKYTWQVRAQLVLAGLS